MVQQYVSFSTAAAVAQDFKTTPEVINVCNAGVMLTMGLPNFFWGPLIPDQTGQLIAGMVVAFVNWRVILYVQAGIIAHGLVLSWLLLKEG